jgi:hypothetical protein
MADSGAIRAFSSVLAVICIGTQLVFTADASECSLNDFTRIEGRYIPNNNNYDSVTVSSEARCLQLCCDARACASADYNVNTRKCSLSSVTSKTYALAISSSRVYLEKVRDDKTESSSTPVFVLVAAGVVGGIVGIALIAVLVAFVYKHCWARRRANELIRSHCEQQNPPRMAPATIALSARPPSPPPDGVVSMHIQATPEHSGRYTTGVHDGEYHTPSAPPFEGV